VVNFDSSLQKLVQDMYETMAVNDGIGLAAVQVGILKNIIIASYQGKKITLINPKIEDSVGQITDEEGCLSCPHKMVKVERAEKIKVKGLNKNGQEITIEAAGFMARIIQHEIDHLDGVLILEKGTIVEEHRDL
ncbi:peptide deformylase, partial [Candidatus Margulisiibacteriota bacterium]